MHGVKKMKKALLVGVLAFGLAGCGTDSESSQEQLNALQEKNAQQQTQIETLEKELTELQAKLEELSIAAPQDEPAEQEEATAFIVQTLSTDGNSYTRTELAVEPKPNENRYEALLRTLFPNLTFNDVTVGKDSTITIDFHEDSTGSPNMTASGQVFPFLDILDYTLAENFPELKGYYIVSNGEPTMIGETGPYEQMQPVAPLAEEDMYLPIEQ